MKYPQPVKLPPAENSARPSPSRLRDRVESVTKALLVLTFALVAAINADAATWYVDQAYTGSTSTGSQAQPYKTINQAITASSTGDTVIVSAGTYRESVTLKAGTSTSPYTLQAATGNRVIVSGFTPVTGWTAYGGTTGAPANSVYTTNTTRLVKSLYSDFTPLQICRFPKSGNGFAQVSSYDSSTSTITLTSPLGFNLSSPQSAFVYYFAVYGQTFHAVPIVSMSNNGQTIVINPQGDAYFNTQAGKSPGDFLLVCNHPSLIATPNDFCYYSTGTASSQLYWYPANGSSQLSTAQTSTINYPLRTSTGSKEVIQGLEVVGGANGIDSNSTDLLTVTNCIIHDNTNNGLYLKKCSNSTVTDSIFIDNLLTNVAISACNGVNFNKNEVAFSGNDNIDCISSGVGTDVTKNFTIYESYIHNAGVVLHADNIQTGGVTGLKILNNLITFGDLITADGYELTNNVFVGSASPQINCGNGAAFGHAAGSQTVTVTNNTLALGNISGISIQDGNTYGSYSISNLVTYIDPLGYNYVTSSNYNDLWDWGTSYLANYNMGTYMAWNTVQDIYNAIGFDGNSTGGDPKLTNVPYAQGLTNLNSGSTSQLVITLPQSTPHTGPGSSISNVFKVNDVVEVDGDGVARTVTSSSYTGRFEATITISPALTVPILRQVLVWDWPAGTTNLVVNTNLASGSAALTSGSGGTRGGSPISSVNYAKDIFVGSTRNTPVLPSGIDYFDRELYPYTGP